MPFLSFFSKRLYRDVGHNWKGMNLAYLFLLLAICCIPATLHVRENMLKSLETGQPDILNQIPEIRIQNGYVTTNQQQPYYIKRSDGTPLAVIDTTGSMNYIDDANIRVLLTETKLIVRNGNNRFNTFDLGGVTDLHINKPIINEWLQAAKSSISPLSYGIFLTLSYIFAVLVVLFVAIIGLILATAMHNPLGFPVALRIATVAATPAIIFIAIAAAANYAIPGMVYLGITLIYLFIGIKSCGRIPKATDEKVDLKALLHEEDGVLKDAA